MKTTLHYLFVALAALMLAGTQPAWALADPYIHIPSDTSIGTWNPNTRKFKLTTDVGQPIQIDEDDLVLEGAGHVVNYPSNGGQGVYLDQRTGVTIGDRFATYLVARKPPVRRGDLCADRDG